jgi:hypothetical protein
MRLKLLTVSALIGMTSFAASAEDSYQPRRFVVEVTTEVPGSEAQFRGVVGYNSNLELIEATTPFRRELVSPVGLTAMFQVVNPDGRLLAALYGEENGELRKLGHVEGTGGMIQETPWDQCSTRIFRGF